MVRSFFGGFALAVAFLAWSAAPGSAGQRHQDREFRGCTYFLDANWAGSSETVEDGDALAWIGDRWNDRISSIDCDPRCELIAYEHIDYGGARQSYRGRVAYVGPQWNDRISSLRVDCGGGRHREWRDGEDTARGCTYYWDSHFRGERVRARSGEENPSIGSHWNDKISSVACDPGCGFEAWEHVRYAGARTVFTGQARTVPNFWNDRISAYRVLCRPRF